MLQLFKRKLFNHHHHRLKSSVSWSLAIFSSTLITIAIPLPFFKLHEIAEFMHVKSNFQCNCTFQALFLIFSVNRCPERLSHFSLTRNHSVVKIISYFVNYRVQSSEDCDDVLVFFWRCKTQETFVILYLIEWIEWSCVLLRCTRGIAKFRAAKKDEIGVLRRLKAALGKK